MLKQISILLNIAVLCTVGCSTPVDISTDDFMLSDPSPEGLPPTYQNPNNPSSPGGNQSSPSFDMGLGMSADMSMSTRFDMSETPIPVQDMELPRPTELECEDEQCDALDNDCDGIVDEGLDCACNDLSACYGGPPHTRGLGECTDGSRTCEGEIWGECSEWQSPQEELCDGLDNDCDLRTDEGVSNACGTCGDVPIEECDGVDNDCDGQIDEGVSNACGTCDDLPEEVCDNVDNDCDGQTDEGTLNACGTCGEPPAETCDNIDNDCDGMVDEDAFNACGTCGAAPDEVCDLIDNDCDGQIDEGVCVVADLDIDGDCVTAQCPMNAPHPIACEINFDGGDSRGCIAHRPGESEVYLQEGNQCGAGRVVGTLTCSTIEGMGLNESNCPINKRNRRYVQDRSDCPDTN